MSTNKVRDPGLGSYLRELTGEDAPDVLVLQRCCWLEEAQANNTFDIPALKESLSEVSDWLDRWLAFGLWREGRLLGMVRAQRENRDWHIGRLAVVPDLRGQGIGAYLLKLAENAVGHECTQFVLHTGSRSYRNIRMYQHHGYRVVADDDQPGVTKLVKPADRSKDQSKE